MNRPRCQRHPGAPTAARSRAKRTPSARPTRVGAPRRPLDGPETAPNARGRPTGDATKPRHNAASARFVEASPSAGARRHGQSRCGRPGGPVAARASFIGAGAIIGIEMRGRDPRVLARRHEEVLRLPGSAGRRVRVAGRRGPGRHELGRAVRSARWRMAPGATMDRP